MRGLPASTLLPRPGSPAPLISTTESLEGAKNFKDWDFVPKIGVKKWHIFSVIIKRARIYNAF